MRLPLLLSAALLATPALACTTIALTGSGRPIVAYNYDFDTGIGQVLINPRGLQKTSSVVNNPVRWESRYGSVTFAQFGRDNPMSGMNEAGPFVSQMWLDETRYETADARPALGVLEWLQHLLDTSATVEEALALAATVRIESRVPLHYAMADASGNAAVVEFISGTMTVRRGESLPHPVLANSTYADSAAFVEASSPVTGISSLARFARAAEAARATPADPVAHAFATLADVAQPGWTRWSVVYDLAERTVRWRSEENAAIREIDLDGFDLACAAPLKALPVHAGVAGDVTAAFADYDADANADLVVRAYAETPFLRHLDPAEVAREARHADSAVCAD
ncbi:MAG TPA: linear amide C-N hydrolase [Rhizobiaceae bacterium]|nr:linear amide C-N hydrolase [Rhizobiaceae bacterium]